MPSGDPLRVLITTEFYLPFQCGVTTAVLNEIKALEVLGDEVRVLTIGNNKHSFWDEEKKCWYIRSNFPSLYKDSYASLALQDKILVEVYQWKPDVIHSQSEFFSFLFASKVSKKLGVPIVHTCHTDFVSYAIHFTRFVRVWNFFAQFVVPFLIRKASRVICSSDKIYDLIKSYRIKQPIDRIMIGLDLDKFNKTLSKEERRSIREKFGFTDNEIVFVSICRLSKEKSVDQVLSLFSNLDIPSSKLIFIGGGEERENLEREVEAQNLKDRVVFGGEVLGSEVWKYYKIGEIYIGASLSETQCLSYVEAMASGMPLLVKDDPVLKGYLINDRNGMIYNSLDDFVLKAGILASSPELRAKMGDEARKTVSRFSLSIFGEKLKKSFDSAIRGRNNG